MDWLKKFRKPSIPPEIKIVARFQGRIEGEGVPVGLAVTGDAKPGEANELLPLIRLDDQTTLADRLLEEFIPELNAWIQGQGDDPIPRAILRLLADSSARGERLADQEAIVFFWIPGVPPKEFCYGPAILAEVIKTRIKMYYEEPGTDQYMVVDFDPE